MWDLKGEEERAKATAKMDGRTKVGGKRVWPDKESYDSWLISVKTPEYRAKISALQKRSWSENRDFRLSALEAGREKAKRKK